MTCLFIGYKLHFIFNRYGEIVSMQITAANIHDCSPIMSLIKDISSKLIVLKDISLTQLSAELSKQDVTLITKIKKRIKN